MTAPPATLALAGGAVFHGRSIGADGEALGEVVFNTAMTGYQEILTDPSYCRQIVTLTVPHVGNTGANREDYESGRVFAAGLVIRDLPVTESNWRKDTGFSDFLRSEGVVSIAGIDTRRLTRILREEGAQQGCILVGEGRHEEALARARAAPGMVGLDLARVVTADSSYEWPEGCDDSAAGWMIGVGEPQFERIVAYDYGIKRNILRSLARLARRVTVLPAETPASEALSLKPDGVFLSNGPGDPEPCGYAIKAVREILGQGTPVLGICLGHQILGLACGARTMKMKFGHHGANHPIVDLDSGEVAISSQNHGFAVDEDSLPDCLRATHRSLFDGTLQGLAHHGLPAIGFQGHPEASPGPHDLGYAFKRFSRLMER
ncbi:MAG: glutamine-hydrolyzing carbamoyl-phosphate synthase small subunit [Gammaproteobacteria bacterium]|nr:glutamine-hydrolyzing carbamoyl-phosphate synthase small subunit [Gammaproteobacteria bacterium]